MDNSMTMLAIYPERHDILPANPENLCWLHRFFNPFLGTDTNKPNELIIKDIYPALENCKMQRVSAEEVLLTMSVRTGRDGHEVFTLANMSTRPIEYQTQFGTMVKSEYSYVLRLIVTNELLEFPEVGRAVNAILDAIGYCMYSERIEYVKTTSAMLRSKIRYMLRNQYDQIFEYEPYMQFYPSDTMPYVQNRSIIDNSPPMFDGHACHSVPIVK